MDMSSIVSVSTKATLLFVCVLLLEMSVWSLFREDAFENNVHRKADSVQRAQRKFGQSPPPTPPCPSCVYSTCDPQPDSQQDVHVTPNQTTIPITIPITDSESVRNDSRCPTRPQSKFGSRNVVLAMGSSYKQDSLRNFAVSCSLYVKSGSCVIFRSATDKNDVATNAWIKKLPNVYFVFDGTDYDAKEAFELVPADLRNPKSPAMTKPALTRILAFKSFLMRHACIFDKIMNTDTRDAFFQSDPFIRITTGLYVSGELYNLRHQPHNMGWLNAIRDPADPAGTKMTDTLDTEFKIQPVIRLRPVLCSGLVAGDAGAIEAWLEAMITLIFRLKYDYQTGIDQGFHNLLFLRYPNLMRPHSTVIVPSLGGWMSNNYPCDANQKIPQIYDVYRMVIPAIIHQYDRCLPLKSVVDAHFATLNKKHFS